MITYRLGVEDLAETRFGISPLTETVFSLWAIKDPGRAALHLPWLRATRAAFETLDTALLLAIVGPTRALPDFLTPRPGVFAPEFDDELAIARATPAADVAQDLRDTYRPDPLPEVWRDDPLTIRDALCDELERFWHLIVEPVWAQLRLLLEADATYRARRLASGGFNELFADLHPHPTFKDGRLPIR